MTVDVRAIRHAQAVAKFGNFSRAASDLGVAQPTLSRSIQALEASLGIQLFDRSPRGVLPTQAGTVFLSHSARVLDVLTELELDIDRLRDVEEGSLDVGVGLHAGSNLLGPILGRLASVHPRLRVVAHPHPWQDNVERLRAGEIEILLGEPSHARLEPDLEVEDLAHEPNVVVCRPGHPLLGVGIPDLADLLRFPLVSPVLPRPVRRWLWEGAQLDGDEALQRIGVPTIVCEHVEALKQIVMASDVVGLTSGSLIGAEYAAGQLEIVPLGTPPPRKDYALIRRAERSQSPAAEAFAACARVVATEIMAASLADDARLDEPGGASE